MVFPLQNKKINRMSCLVGAIAAFAGIAVDSNVLFVAGLALGVAGYLGIRKGLRRSLEERPAPRDGGEEENH